MRKVLLALVLIVSIAALAAGCTPAAQPTATRTGTPAATHTPTPTPGLTAMPTASQPPENGLGARLPTGGAVIGQPLGVALGDSVWTVSRVDVLKDPNGTSVPGAVLRFTGGAIVGGPRTARGEVWWQVVLDNDVVGWAPASALEPWVRPTGAFSIGDTVKATVNVMVRTRPGTDEPLVRAASMPAGLVGTVQPADSLPRIVGSARTVPVKRGDGGPSGGPTAPRAGPSSRRLSPLKQ